jgi:cation:H+ antiporter
VRSGDHQLAISDIFGGNAFLPVLFLLATLLSGKAVLPHPPTSTSPRSPACSPSSTPRACRFRPERRFAGMGVDSLVVLGLYVIGVAGLFEIAASG